jgi:glutathione S-transferase
MITIYGDIDSGNCYKIYLLCHLLDIEFQWQAMDIAKGDLQTTEFLAKNPQGKVPLVELADGRFLTESNAILHYLAKGSKLVPADAYLNAKVYQWLFFEQYSHEPYIAVARFIKRFQGMPESRKAEFESKQGGGHKALKVMNDQLSQTAFLIGEQFSLADIALYAYTHVAEEGGFNLVDYPAIRRWIKQIQLMPNYVGMQLKN